MNFDSFRSAMKHKLKSLGDCNFIIELLKSDYIDLLWKENKQVEAMYLVGMLDYLLKILQLEPCKEYDYVRQNKLKEPLYPEGMVIYSKATNKNIKDIVNNPIPEFLRFNIIEENIRDVV